MVLASPPLWTKPYPYSVLKEVDTKEDEIQFNLEGKVSHFKVNFCNNRTFKYWKYHSKLSTSIDYDVAQKTIWQ